MEPKLPNEEIFQRQVYAYMIKKGYVETAKIFQQEAQLTESVPDPNEPPGFMSDFWNSFYEVYKSSARQPIEQISPQNQQPSNTSMQSQVLVQQPSNTSMQNQVLVQQPGNTSMQNQVILQQPLNIGPVINTTTAPITPILFLTSFRSDGSSLLSCDISSDGKIVASGGYGKKPFICYMETRRFVTTQDTHNKTITEVRFHPSFNLFATASRDRSLKLWDAATPETVLRYREHAALTHRKAVKSLDFHPFDNSLCSSDGDAIRVWNLHTYGMANRDTKKGGTIVRVEPVFGRLVAVAKGKCITILDYHNLAFGRKLEGHVGDIKSICWDVTGEMIASVSEDEVRVWSARQGKCLHSYSSNGKKFQSVIFHPGYDMTLVIGEHKCLLLLDLVNKREYTTPATELSITGLAATRAGAQSQFIASASESIHCIS